ncbi:PP2C family protein-serine/threonine phosphatase [Streptomyces collinus]|uniref:PP2C family protein-serine/threonine phosphatase n=1 Tax=Streptomyces collinus TaxID=42684 RepID=UPI0033D09E82
MERNSDDRRAMLADLLHASHLMPVEALPAQASECAATAGLHQVLIYLSDLQRTKLCLLAETEEAARLHEAELPIEGTVAGRAYQYGGLMPASPAGTGEFEWWVPLLDGTERLGLLRVSARHNDPGVQSDLEALASLVALIIVSKRVTSDALAKLVRARPMSLAAEMQWNLLPPRTYADGRVAISAALEPAYDISGDVFDYAIDGPSVHLAIFDAMGHDTAAGLSGALALGACRNARRQGVGLIGDAEAVESALLEQYDHQRYVTGILARLDTRTGILRWVNRGHHPPIVIRDTEFHFQSGTGDLADVTPVDGLYFIGASSRYEKAKSPLGGRLTHFTHTFVDVVGNGILGKPAELTLRQIFVETRARLVRERLPQPVDGGVRDAFHRPDADGTDGLGAGGPGPGGHGSPRRRARPVRRRRPRPVRRAGGAAGPGTSRAPRPADRSRPVRGVRPTRSTRRSARTADGWPSASSTAPSSCGTSPPAGGPSSCPTSPARPCWAYAPWHSARTARSSRARTAEIRRGTPGSTA